MGSPAANDARAYNTGCRSARIIEKTVLSATPALRSADQAYNRAIARNVQQFRRPRAVFRHFANKFP
jgi:hypothetical protein